MHLKKERITMDELDSHKMQKSSEICRGQRAAVAFWYSLLLSLLNLNTHMQQNRKKKVATGCVLIPSLRQCI